ncbi:MAG: glycosyltransferase family 4 protein [Fusobacteriaceae bacterium]
MEKICFVTPQFKTGGGNRVFVELANELVKDNHVEIIYPNNSNETNTFELNKNIKILSLGKYKSSKIFKLLNMLYSLFWIRKNKKDCKIVITDPIMSLFYFILPQENLFRFIQADDYRIFDDKAIIKNEIILKIYKMLTKLSYKSKKVNYIFNSKYVYNLFLKDSKNNVEYKLVHPAINKKKFYDKKIRLENELNICIVARKHPFKGFSTFVEAWKKLSLKEKIDNVYIISHDDLSSFSLSESKFKIIVPKSDEEISDTMNKSHIFISTSWCEGFGLPSLEAMASGCSVVTSDSGGVNEYAKNNYNCYIYPPKDVDMLVQKIEELVLDSLKREKLILNSANTIKEFSWQKSSKDFFKEITRGN